MLKRGRGCLHCRQTGYSGRDGIFEILPITDAIRRLVTEQADSARLFEAGPRRRHADAARSGHRESAQGTTTVSEMVRVAGK